MFPCHTLAHPWSFLVSEIDAIVVGRDTESHPHRLIVVCSRCIFDPDNHQPNHL